MAVDPRLPVIVGASQLVQRPADLHDAHEAIGLMREVVAAAGADTGAPGLLPKADLVVAVKGAWRYSDVARLVADDIGATSARTAITTDGGNTPQSLVNKIAVRIAAGDLDVAVIVGAETIWSRRRMRAQGIERHPTEQTGVTPDEVLGTDLQMSGEAERRQGFEMPVNFYPTFESAIRHHQGETIDEHRDRISRLWEGFNKVAVANPYAWFRTPMTAAEIREATPDNRMVGFPYTKAMNSNWDLDQAAALVICSAGAAEACGVPRDRTVFLHAGTDAHDTPLVSNRDNLWSSPAIAAAGRKLFELAGAGVDDLAHADLYSCFPSAVQISANALGLSQGRPLTVTGGLTFAGGPLNNYVTHSIATMTGLLRSGDAGALGLITANGGYITKHALGVYSTSPPAGGFRWEDVQAEADAGPQRELADGFDGPVTIEAYTVMHGKEGPEKALFAGLLDDGRRAWGNSTDDATMKAVMEDEHIGRAAHIAADGSVNLD